MSKENGYRRQLGSVGNIKVRSSVRIRGAKEVEGLPSQKRAEVSLLECLEGVGGVRVGLGRVEDGGETVVEDDQTTPVTGRGGRCSRDGLVEVGRTVRRHVRVRSHGSGSNEGLGAVEREVYSKRLVGEVINIHTFK